MEIQYVTHSSILVRDDISLLTDPFYFLDPLSYSFMTHFPPHEIQPSSFGDIDFCFCSHDHDDHSHFETLQALRPFIHQMVLPAGKELLRRRVERAGYDNIIFLEDKKTVTLAPDLHLTCYHDLNGIDTALIIKFKSCTILHQNDCPLDSAAFRDMAERFSIDYAFVPHTACQDLYPLLLPYPDDKKEELAREKEKFSFERIERNLNIIEPQNIIPYGYTQIYTNEDQLALNGFSRITPKVFCDLYKARHPSSNCFCLQPGDIIDTEKNIIHPIRSENLWGNNLEEYLENIKTFTKTNRNTFPRLEFGDPQSIDEKVFAFFEKRLQMSFPEDLGNQTIIIHSQGDTPDSLTYYIDTEKKEITRQSDNLPFLEITMPATVLNQLMEGKFNIFSILFCYRVHFQLNIFLGMDPQSECVFYTMAIISLFDPKMHQELWADTINKNKALKQIDS